MKRDQVKGLFEFIGIISIVVTLIFVGLEIRQNTNAVHSAVIQSLTDQTIVANALYLENESLREAIRAARAGTATADQRSQVNVFYALGLRLSQNRYMQVKLGIVSEATILATGGDSSMYRSEDFKQWWEANQHLRLPDDFLDFMENVIMVEYVEE